MPLGKETLEWCGYPTVKKFWSVYSFWHNPRTWQTHTHTYTGKFIFCPCIALDRQKLRNFYTPPVFSAPAGGDPDGVSWRCLMMIKTEWFGYREVKKLWQYVKPFSSITRTSRTDERTHLPFSKSSQLLTMSCSHKFFHALYLKRLRSCRVDTPTHPQTDISENNATVATLSPRMFRGNYDSVIYGFLDIFSLRRCTTVVQGHGNWYQLKAGIQ